MGSSPTIPTNYLLFKGFLSKESGGQNLPPLPFYLPFKDTQYHKPHYNNPKNPKTMSAKQQAIEDIKKDLKRQGKCFLAFHTVLDPIMRQLVRQQLKQQLKLHQQYG